MVRIDVQLPPEQANVVWEAMLAAVDAGRSEVVGTPAESSASAEVRREVDPSVLEAERADALVNVAQAYLQHDQPRTLGSGYELVMLTTPEQLEHAPGGVGGFLRDGTPVPHHIARMLACDCSRVDVTTNQSGEILDVGRARRTIPAAIGRALWLRDGGCRMPGCGREHHLHAHHIEAWADGGKTSKSIPTVGRIAPGPRIRDQFGIRLTRIGSRRSGNSSDDAKAKSTRVNRLWMGTVTTVVGSLDEMHRDYKSRAYNEMVFRDILAVHHPSGVWAQYDDASGGNTDLGHFVAVVPSPNCNYELAGNGIEMTDGTLVAGVSDLGWELCDTNLYVNLGDHESGNLQSCMESLGWSTATYGLVWNSGENSACNFNDPHAASLGPRVQCELCANGSSSLEDGGYGYGQLLGLNTGLPGSGENRIEIFIR